MKIFGYIAFGLFSLIVGLYWTFPGGAVAQRLTHEIRKSTEGKVVAKFDDVDLYGLTGMTAEGIRLQVRGDGPEPMSIRVDELSTRLQILPLFLLKPVVSTALALGDSRINAEVTRLSQTEVEFELETEKRHLLR